MGHFKMRIKILDRNTSVQFHYAKCWTRCVWDIFASQFLEVWQEKTPECPFKVLRLQQSFTQTVISSSVFTLMVQQANSWGGHHATWSSKREKKGGDETLMKKGLKRGHRSGKSDGEERSPSTGGGVTCQVMHQIFNQVSNYGISGHYDQHHPDKDVGYVRRQSYSVSRWGNVVDKIRLLLCPFGQLEEPSLLKHQLCEVQEASWGVQGHNWLLVHGGYCHL